MKNLIEEARKRVAEISKASKDNYYGKYLQIYESENGYTIGHIQNGWSTRTKSISFGEKPLTKKEVIEIIQKAEYDWEEYEKFTN